MQKTLSVYTHRALYIIAIEPVAALTQYVLPK